MLVCSPIKVYQDVYLFCNLLRVTCLDNTLLNFAVALSEDKIFCFKSGQKLALHCNVMAQMTLLGRRLRPPDIQTYLNLAFWSSLVHTRRIQRIKVFLAWHRSDFYLHNNQIINIKRESQKVVYCRRCLIYYVFLSL